MKLNRQIVGVFALALNSAYGSNILLNAGFETPLVSNGTFTQLGSGSSALTNWTVTGAACGGNCILVIQTNYTEGSNAGTLQFQAHGGNNSLDITGAGNTVDGGVSQTVSLTPGLQYLLSFWVANMDDRASNYPLPASVQLLIGGASQGTFTNSNSTNNFNNWQQFSDSFTPLESSVSIEFRNATPAADNLAGLDDVFLDVAAPVSSVPEPATFGLMALALGAIPVLRRMRG
jgi:hypothetical protein